MANGSDGGEGSPQEKTRYFCHSCGGVSTHPITPEDAKQLREEGHQIEALPLKPQPTEVVRG